MRNPILKAFVEDISRAWDPVRKIFDELQVERARVRAFGEILQRHDFEKDIDRRICRVAKILRDVRDQTIEARTFQDEPRPPVMPGDRIKAGPCKVDLVVHHCTLFPDGWTVIGHTDENPWGYSIHERCTWDGVRLLDRHGVEIEIVVSKGSPSESASVPTGGDRTPHKEPPSSVLFVLPTEQEAREFSRKRIIPRPATSGKQFSLFD